MGKIIRLNGVTLTDALAPKIIERDAIESEGSLFLYDGAHEFGSFAGVWPSGGTVPNALANKAASILGVAEETLNPTVSIWAPVAGVFAPERTSKGGFHGLISQVNQTGANAVSLNFPGAIKTHVRLNPARGFYASLWSRVTRVGIANTAGQSPFHLATNTGNHAFYFDAGSAGQPQGAASLGRSNFPATNDHQAQAVPFNRFGALGWNANTGTGPDSGSVMSVGVGNFGPWGGFNTNKTPSRIIYRAYLEDLTASGRTFAQVQAIDYALYQAAFAPGGKFHGDAYTDPATLP